MALDDRFEVAELIYASINVWYQQHGLPPIFVGGPRITEIFYEVYHALAPGCAVVAEAPDTRRLMGSCFYHPRKHHVSLGIMNVHPNHFGKGVGRALLQSILDFADQHDYKAVRLTSSALNLDSFSLYNRAGFVPRCVYQDMVLRVPQDGPNGSAPAGTERVRPARSADVPALAALEMDISGISRAEDYGYCIANTLGFWRTLVYENSRGDIDGLLISSAHPALRMLGPVLARTEAEAAALLWCGLDHHRDQSPVVLVPVERSPLVAQMYGWGARNCELHLCQVRGEFQPFRGISMPTFLPETG
jgi:GNAT superfamily N-acetyltransferase